jgi:hypothetical protein
VTSDIAGISLDGAQAGDVSVGDVAAGNLVKITGADANKILGLLEAQIRYAWDDDQRREARQAQVDADRQHDLDAAAMHWQMTRQRLDVIVTRLDHLDTATAETHAEARRVRVAGAILAAVLALIIIAVIVIAIDRYYLAGGLLRSIVGAAGATGIYYVRSR